MSACPHCGNNLTIKVEKGKHVNRRPAKDPKEIMLIDDFIKGCKESKARHINIVGDYADTLKEMKLLNGEWTTRGEWNEFMVRNVAIAKKMMPFKDEQITSAMQGVEKSLKVNGGYMDKFTLETVYKFMVK